MWKHWAVCQRNQTQIVHKHLQLEYADLHPGLLTHRDHVSTARNNVDPLHSLKQDPQATRRPPSLVQDPSRPRKLIQSCPSPTGDHLHHPLHDWKHSEEQQIGVHDNPSWVIRPDSRLLTSIRRITLIHNHQSPITYDMTPYVVIARPQRTLELNMLVD